LAEFLLAVNTADYESGLPVWVKNGPNDPVTPLPNYPEERTSSGSVGMSQKCQHATSNVQVAQKEKAARRRLSILIIVDQAAINAGSDFGRWAVLADNDF
jgi:hypothetical protein